jgi:hypothetical protein
MREIGALGVIVIASIAGCGSRTWVHDGGPSRPDARTEGRDAGAGALFADLQYAIRCEATLGCAGVIEHDICGFDEGDTCVDGAPPASLSCTVIEGDATRLIRFSAQQGGGSSIAVTDLAVIVTGGSPSPGGACRVTVQEGASTYSGSCGPAAPSDAQPCQISDVRFVDDAGNPTVEARMLCQFLENEANPALEIEVTAIGVGPAPAGTPARIRIANCAGMTCTPDTCITL